MRVIIRILFIVLGITLGLYFGVWWAFIGGIVAIIEGVKATPVSSWLIATGIARVLLSSLIGWGTFLICSFVGAVLIKSSK